MIEGKHNSKLFVVTKWLLPGPERACKLAPPEGGFNYLIGKTPEEQYDKPYLTPIKPQNGTKAAKVLGDEVKEEAFHFREPQKVKALRDESKFSEFKTPESCKKGGKAKALDGKKAPESFLRSLKRRSLRVTRSKSWVTNEKRKSGEWPIQPLPPVQFKKKTEAVRYPIFFHLSCSLNLLAKSESSPPV